MLMGGAMSIGLCACGGGLGGNEGVEESENSAGL